MLEGIEIHRCAIIDPYLLEELEDVKEYLCMCTLSFGQFYIAMQMLRLRVNVIWIPRSVSINPWIELSGGLQKCVVRIDGRDFSHFYLNYCIFICKR